MTDANTTNELEELLVGLTPKEVELIRSISPERQLQAVRILHAMQKKHFEPG